MMRKLIIAYILIALVIGAVSYYLFFSESVRKEACMGQGGRWVASRQLCQTPACYDSASCLPSYNNSAVCRDLPVGISERELVFQLGQPIKAEGNILLFTASPTSSDLLRITMSEERRVERLECERTESNNVMHPSRISVDVVR